MSPVGQSDLGVGHFLGPRMFLWDVPEQMWHHHCPAGGPVSSGVVVLLGLCLGGWFVSRNPDDCQDPGFPAEHCTVLRWSVWFIMTVSGFNVEVGCHACMYFKWDCDEYIFVYTPASPDNFWAWITGVHQNKSSLNPSSTIKAEYDMTILVCKDNAVFCRKAKS